MNKTTDLSLPEESLDKTDSYAWSIVLDFDEISPGGVPMGEVIKALENLE